MDANNLKSKLSEVSQTTSREEKHLKTFFFSRPLKNIIKNLFENMFSCFFLNQTLPNLTQPQLSIFNINWLRSSHYGYCRFIVFNIFFYIITDKTKMKVFPFEMWKLEFQCYHYLLPVFYKH